MIPSYLVKNVAVVISVVFLINNCLLAYAPEKNFWAQRKKHLNQTHKQGNNVQMAQLPQASQVLQTLPQIHTQSVHTLTPNIKKQLKKTPPQHAQVLTKIINAIPSQFGDIRKITLPSKNTQHIVLHIQDVHMNHDAQKNIGAVVKHLMPDRKETDSVKANILALEGAFAPIQLFRFQNFPYPKAVETAADYLLKTHKISGPVHAMLTVGEDLRALPSIIGIDDETHYRANVRAYQESEKTRPKIKKQLSVQQAHLAEQKQKTFNPALFQFDQKVQAYAQKQISLGQYINELVAHSNKNNKFRPPRMLGGPISSPKGANFVAKGRQFLSDYPNLHTFQKTLKIEQSLDFKKVESERKQLIQTLVQCLNKTQINELVQHSMAYKAGQIRFTDFYAYLRKICQGPRAKGKGKNNDKNFLSAYPSMDQYVQYVLLADQIQAENLFQEIKDLKQKIYTRLTQTQKEKQLVQEGKYLILTEKLLNFSLTPEEWKEYKKIEISSFQSRNWPPAGTKLARSAREIKNKKNILNLSSFKNFYRHAESRDKAMVDNLLQNITNSKNNEFRPPSIHGGPISSAMNAWRTNFANKVSQFPPKSHLVILVTGGFHSPGITQKLTKSGCTVITWVPKIEKIDTAKGSSYLSVFTQEKTPLEKLFKGEKLFLSPEQVNGLTGLPGLALSNVNRTNDFPARQDNKLFDGMLPDETAENIKAEAHPINGRQVLCTETSKKTGQSVQTTVTYTPEGNISSAKSTPKPPVINIIAQLTRVKALSSFRIGRITPAVIAQFIGRILLKAPINRQTTAPYLKRVGSFGTHILQYLTVSPKPRVMGISIVILASVLLFDFTPDGWADISSVLIKVILLIGSMSLHEYAHARVASYFGDTTAQDQGRLTVVKFWRHLSFKGTLIFVVSTLIGMPFGFLKPVPIKLDKLSEAQERIVKLSGPCANIVLSVIFGVSAFTAHLMGISMAFQILQYAAILNMGMGMFNLIRLPWLDGSALLPKKPRKLSLRTASSALLAPLVVLGLFFLSSSSVSSAAVQVSVPLVGFLGICERIPLDNRLLAQIRRGFRKKKKTLTKEEEQQELKKVEGQIASVVKNINETAQRLMLLGREGKLQTNITDLHNLSGRLAEIIDAYVYELKKKGKRLNPAKAAKHIAKALVEKGLIVQQDLKALQDLLQKDPVLMEKTQNALTNSFKITESLDEEAESDLAHLLQHAREEHHHSHDHAPGAHTHAKIATTVSSILMILMSVGLLALLVLLPAFSDGNITSAVMGLSLPLAVMNIGDSFDNPKSKTGHMLSHYTVNLSQQAKNKLLDAMGFIKNTSDHVQKSLAANSPVLLVGDPDMADNFTKSLAYLTENQEDYVNEGLKKSLYLDLNIPGLIPPIGQRSFEKYLKETLDAVCDKARQSSGPVVLTVSLDDCLRAMALDPKQDKDKGIVVVQLLERIMNEPNIRLLVRSSKRLLNTAAGESLIRSNRYSRVDIVEGTRYDVSVLKKMLMKWCHEKNVKIEGDENGTFIAEYIDKARQSLSFGETLAAKVLEILDRLRASAAQQGASYNVQKQFLIQRLSRVEEKYQQAQRAGQNLEPYETEQSRIMGLIRQLDEVYAVSGQKPELVTITQENILKEFSKEAGVQESAIEKTFKDRVNGLAAAITKHDVFGQDEAVRSVVSVLSNRASGTAANYDSATQTFTRPAGPFTFVGPTGVGKTELAKSLAKRLYGAEKSLIRLDMSEYSEKHTVTKLKGASPSYVGSDDTSERLVERVKSNDNVVILFDEIEKAHPDVLKEIMNMLDSGYMSDNYGNLVSFRNATIVFTSNFGYTHEIYDAFVKPAQEKREKLAELKASLFKTLKKDFSKLMKLVDLIQKNTEFSDMIQLYQDQNSALLERLKPIMSHGRVELPDFDIDLARQAVLLAQLSSEVLHLESEMKQNVDHYWDNPPDSSVFQIPPEIAGRMGLDKKIHFKPLSSSTVRRIVKKELARFIGQVKKNCGIQLEFPEDGSVYQYITDRAYTPTDGARPIRREINDSIIDPLAVQLLKEKVKKGDAFRLEVKNDKLQFVHIPYEEEEKEVFEPVDRTVIQNALTLKPPNPDDTEIERLKIDVSLTMQEEEALMQIPEEQRNQAREELLKDKKEKINACFDHLSGKARAGEILPAHEDPDAMASAFNVITGQTRRYSLLLKGQNKEDIDSFVNTMALAPDMRFIKLNPASLMEHLNPTAYELALSDIVETIVSDAKEKNLPTHVYINLDELDELIAPLRLNNIPVDLYFILKRLRERANGVRLIVGSTKPGVEDKLNSVRFQTMIQIPELTEQEMVQECFMRMPFFVPLEVVEKTLSIIREYFPSLEPRTTLHRWIQEAHAQKRIAPSQSMTQRNVALGETAQILNESIDRQAVFGNTEAFVEDHAGVIENLRELSLLERTGFQDARELTVKDMVSFAKIKQNEKSIEKGTEKSQKYRPFAELTYEERKDLLELDDIIKKTRVQGQEEAVDLVVKAVRRQRLGLKLDPERPLSFVFDGPTGIGKTELAKAVAELGVGKMHHFNMNEYRTKDKITTLIGSPPGYQGYGESGILAKLVKEDPYAVLLIDDVHMVENPQLLNLFLQILDAGRLTDPEGQIVDFRHTTIVFTSNGGMGQGGELYDQMVPAILKNDSKEIARVNGLIEQGSENFYKRFFTPELRNRLDYMLSFKTLTLDVIQDILKRRFKKLMRNYHSQGYGLQFGNNKEHETQIVRKLVSAWNPRFGFRDFDKDGGVLDEVINTPIQFYQNALNEWSADIAAYLKGQEIPEPQVEDFEDDYEAYSEAVEIYEAKTAFLQTYFSSDLYPDPEHDLFIQDPFLKKGDTIIVLPPLTENGLLRFRVHRPVDAAQEKTAPTIKPLEPAERAVIDDIYQTYAARLKDGQRFTSRDVESLINGISLSAQNGQSVSFDASIVKTHAAESPDFIKQDPVLNQGYEDLSQTVIEQCGYSRDSLMLLAALSDFFMSASASGKRSTVEAYLRSYKTEWRSRNFDQFTMADWEALLQHNGPDLTNTRTLMCYQIKDNKLLAAVSYEAGLFARYHALLFDEEYREQKGLLTCEGIEQYAAASHDDSEAAKALEPLLKAQVHLAARGGHLVFSQTSKGSAQTTLWVELTLPEKTHDSAQNVLPLLLLEQEKIRYIKTLLASNPQPMDLLFVIETLFQTGTPEAEELLRSIPENSPEVQSAKASGLQIFEMQRQHQAAIEHEEKRGESREQAEAYIEQRLNRLPYSASDDNVFFDAEGDLTDNGELLVQALSFVNERIPLGSLNMTFKKSGDKWVLGQTGDTDYITTLLATGDYPTFEDALLAGLAWGIRNLTWGDRYNGAVQAKEAYQWKDKTVDVEQESVDLIRALIQYLGEYEIEPDAGREAWIQTYIAPDDPLRKMKELREVLTLQIHSVLAEKEQSQLAHWLSYIQSNYKNKPIPGFIVDQIKKILQDEIENWEKIKTVQELSHRVYVFKEVYLFLSASENDYQNILDLIHEHLVKNQKFHSTILHSPATEQELLEKLQEHSINWIRQYYAPDQPHPQTPPPPAPAQPVDDEYEKRKEESEIKLTNPLTVKEMYDQVREKFDYQDPLILEAEIVGRGEWEGWRYTEEDVSDIYFEKKFSINSDPDDKESIMFSFSRGWDEWDLFSNFEDVTVYKPFCAWSAITGELKVDGETICTTDFNPVQDVRWDEEIKEMIFDISPEAPVNWPKNNEIRVESPGQTITAVLRPGLKQQSKDPSSPVILQTVGQLIDHIVKNELRYQDTNLIAFNRDFALNISRTEGEKIKEITIKTISVEKKISFSMLPIAIVPLKSSDEFVVIVENAVDLRYQYSDFSNYINFITESEAIARLGGLRNGSFTVIEGMAAVLYNSGLTRFFHNPGNSFRLQSDGKFYNDRSFLCNININRDESSWNMELRKDRGSMYNHFADWRQDGKLSVGKYGDKLEAEAIENPLVNYRYADDGDKTRIILILKDEVCQVLRNKGFEPFVTEEMFNHVVIDIESESEYLAHQGQVDEPNDDQSSTTDYAIQEGEPDFILADLTAKLGMFYEDKEYCEGICDLLQKHIESLEVIPESKQKLIKDSQKLIGFLEKNQPDIAQRLTNIINGLKTQTPPPPTASLPQTLLQVIKWLSQSSFQKLSTLINLPQKPKADDQNKKKLETAEDLKRWMSEDIGLEGTSIGLNGNMDVEIVWGEDSPSEANLNPRLSGMENLTTLIGNLRANNYRNKEKLLNIFMQKLLEQDPLKAFLYIGLNVEVITFKEIDTIHADIKNMCISELTIPPGMKDDQILLLLQRVLSLVQVRGLGLLDYIKDMSPLLQLFQQHPEKIRPWAEFLRFFHDNDMIMDRAHTAYKDLGNGHCDYVPAQRGFEYGKMVFNYTTEPHEILEVLYRERRKIGIDTMHGFQDAENELEALKAMSQMSEETMSEPVVEDEIQELAKKISGEQYLSTQNELLLGYIEKACPQTEADKFNEFIKNRTAPVLTSVREIKEYLITQNSRDAKKGDETEEVFENRVEERTQFINKLETLYEELLTLTVNGLKEGKVSLQEFFKPFETAEEGLGGNDRYYFDMRDIKDPQSTPSKSDVIVVSARPDVALFNQLFLFKELFHEYHSKGKVLDINIAPEVDALIARSHERENIEEWLKGAFVFVTEIEYKPNETSSPNGYKIILDKDLSAFGQLNQFRKSIVNNKNRSQHVDMVVEKLIEIDPVRAFFLFACGVPITEEEGEVSVQFSDDDSLESINVPLPMKDKPVEVMTLIKEQIVKTGNDDAKKIVPLIEYLCENPNAIPNWADMLCFCYETMGMSRTETEFVVEEDRLQLKNGTAIWSFQKNKEPLKITDLRVFLRQFCPAHQAIIQSRLGYMQQKRYPPVVPKTPPPPTTLNLDQWLSEITQEAAQYGAAFVDAITAVFEELGADDINVFLNKPLTSYSSGRRLLDAAMPFFLLPKTLQTMGGVLETYLRDQWQDLMNESLLPNSISVIDKDGQAAELVEIYDAGSLPDGRMWVQGELTGKGKRVLLYNEVEKRLEEMVVFDSDNEPHSLNRISYSGDLPNGSFWVQGLLDDDREKRNKKILFYDKENKKFKTIPVYADSDYHDLQRIYHIGALQEDGSFWMRGQVENNANKEFFVNQDDELTTISDSEAANLVGDKLSQVLLQNGGRVYRLSRDGMWLLYEDNGHLMFYNEKTGNQEEVALNVNGNVSQNLLSVQQVHALKNGVFLMRGKVGDEYNWHECMLFYDDAKNKLKEVFVFKEGNKVDLIIKTIHRDGVFPNGTQWMECDFEGQNQGILFFDKENKELEVVRDQANRGIAYKGGALPDGQLWMWINSEIVLYDEHQKNLTSQTVFNKVKDAGSMPDGRLCVLADDGEFLLYDKEKEFFISIQLINANDQKVSYTGLNQLYFSNDKLWLLKGELKGQEVLLIYDDDENALRVYDGIDLHTGTEEDIAQEVHNGLFIIGRERKEGETKDKDSLFFLPSGNESFDVYGQIPAELAQKFPDEHRESIQTAAENVFKQTPAEQVQDMLKAALPTLPNGIEFLTALAQTFQPSQDQKDPEKVQEHEPVAAVTKTQLLINMAAGLHNGDLKPAEYEFVREISKDLDESNLQKGMLLVHKTDPVILEFVELTGRDLKAKNIGNEEVDAYPESTLQDYLVFSSAEEWAKWEFLVEFEKSKIIDQDQSKSVFGSLDDFDKNVPVANQLELGDIVLYAHPEEEVLLFCVGDRLRNGDAFRGVPLAGGEPSGFNDEYRGVLKKICSKQEWESVQEAVKEKLDLLRAKILKDLAAGKSNGILDKNNEIEELFDQCRQVDESYIGMLGVGDILIYKNEEEKKYILAIVTREPMRAHVRASNFCASGGETYKVSADEVSFFARAEEWKEVQQAVTESQKGQQASKVGQVMYSMFWLLAGGGSVLWMWVAQDFTNPMAWILAGVSVLFFVPSVVWAIIFPQGDIAETGPLQEGLSPALIQTVYGNGFLQLVNNSQFWAAAGVMAEERYHMWSTNMFPFISSSKLWALPFQILDEFFAKTFAIVTALFVKDKKIKAYTEAVSSIFNGRMLWDSPFSGSMGDEREGSSGEDADIGVTLEQLMPGAPKLGVEGIDGTGLAFIRNLAEQSDEFKARVFEKALTPRTPSITDAVLRLQNIVSEQKTSSLEKTPVLMSVVTPQNRLHIGDAGNYATISDNSHVKLVLVPTDDRVREQLVHLYKTHPHVTVFDTVPVQNSRLDIPLLDTQFTQWQTQFNTPIQLTFSAPGDIMHQSMLNLVPADSPFRRALAVYLNLLVQNMPITHIDLKHILDLALLAAKHA